VNLTAAAERACEALDDDQPVLIVCAGREGAFSLDNAYCAGRLASAIFGGTKPRRALNDAGLASLDLVRRYGSRWERPLAYSRAGRELIRLGFRADVHRRITLIPVPV
jgi:2-phosphosulfolactate phosphatase